MTEWLWQLRAYRTRESLVSLGIVHSVRTSTMALRDVLVRLHRYAGLTMAIFLALAGLTGSVITFHHELDEWLNPELYHVASRGAPLPLGEIEARVEQFDPRARVASVPLTTSANRSLALGVSPRIDATTGQPFALDYNQLFVDPVTGNVMGKRLWGACCVARQQLIPFLYVLHYTLHLPKRWGVWFMGGIAIIWMFDCFIGAYLTFPRGRPFFIRWRPAWLVKRGAGVYRINFDLHRAGGLWCWGLLLILAVSGASFNLNREIFQPIVSFFSPITPSVFAQRQERHPNSPIEPLVSLDSVLVRAREEAARRGWDAQPYGIFYSPSFGLFGVGFGEEHPTGLGSPRLYFDGKDGHLIGERIPGAGTAGDVFLQLQFPLHSGQIAGLPGRIVICATGVVVAMLSITGVVIWLRKRQARLRSAERRALFDDVAIQRTEYGS